MHESGHHNEAKVVTMIIKWRVEMYLRILYFQFKVLYKYIINKCITAPDKYFGKFLQEFEHQK